jgi:hypothetical protein
MTVATPWILWLTGAAVLGTLVAHLFSLGRPSALVLPTARFVPPSRAVTRTRSLVPRDRLLLALRLLALLAIGLACAGVAWRAGRAPVATFVLLDLEARDSLAARAVVTAQPALAGVVLRSGRVLDSAVGAGASLPDVGDGSLAGALLAARRAAASRAMGADSVALVVVSRFGQDATTPALSLVRATWPGRVELREVTGAAVATADAETAEAAPADEATDAVSAADAVQRTLPTVEVVRSARADDVVAAAFAADEAASIDGEPARSVRVVRASLLRSDDSAHARAGGVLVHWPAEDASGDTTSAVVARGMALVTPLARRRALSVLDTPVRTRPDDDTTPRLEPVVWWPDGAPAAVQQSLGAGCVRTVGFAAPEGDALLTPAARGVLDALRAPCAGLAMPPLDALARAMLRDSLAPLATPAQLGAPVVSPSVATARWLLALGVLLLLLEWVLRDRLGGESRVTEAA